ncbi:MAG: hypothetical protein COB40_12170 [Marinosulfonomonas sp.]|nr:MAG: hypothetical protein COB40_12170 [Marinosulfonomonas sp.]
MATLRQYFDTDFSNATKLTGTVEYEGQNIEAKICYDFVGGVAFFACYIPRNGKINILLSALLEKFANGSTQINFDGHVGLPEGKSFPGEIYVDNGKTFNLKARISGDNEWVSIHEFERVKRIFIYTETMPIKKCTDRLRSNANEKGVKILFRSKKYVETRTRNEVPFAFLSHDSRDKEIAREIATYLQNRMCPVWYDEFSLAVGDHLRDSIEQGLKDSKKCVLLLSKNFLSNSGWTKKEFDSVFTRELVEEKKLILPVWLNVSQKEVFEYSPSLANVYALNWSELGKEKVCEKLHRAIL